ncbi:MAG: hypothetical protein U0263_24330 [Polyangiaceae bacterium]
MSNTRVRFVESGSGVLSLLEVEAASGRGLFARVARALYAERVQIVRAESRVAAGLRQERFWVVELDGGPVRPHRRLQIQVEVLASVEGEPPRAGYLTSSRPRGRGDGAAPPAA